MRYVLHSVIALLIALAPAAGLLTMATAAYAQRIPDPGPPRMVAVPCPGWKKWIDTPDGKMPKTCPHCGYSFVRKARQTPTPGAPKPAPQNTDPYKNDLYFGVPLNSADGKRPSAPNTLAARAEEWARQMKQADEQSRRLQKAQAQEFERRKQAILNAQPGKPQLWNAYGGDPNVVDLTGHEAGKPRLLRNPFHADGAPASGALTEHAQVRQFTEQAKYAHMRPDELDALAAQYPGNAEVQQAVASLKAKVKSMDALGETSEEVRRNEDLSASEQRNGNREALRATSTALDLTVGIPGGLDDVLYGEKTVGEWMGVDATSAVAKNRLQDVLVEEGELLALHKGWSAPGAVTALGGLGGVVHGVTAVGDLVDFAKATNAAGDHYVNAAELRAQAEAAGGTVGAVGAWSRMREQAQNESARLHRLIQEEEARRRPRKSAP